MLLYPATTRSIKRIYPSHLRFGKTGGRVQSGQTGISSFGPHDLRSAKVRAASVNQVTRESIVANAPAGLFARYQYFRQHGLIKGKDNLSALTKAEREMGQWRMRQFSSQKYSAVEKQVKQMADYQAFLTGEKGRLGKGSAQNRKTWTAMGYRKGADGEWRPDPKAAPVKAWKRLQKLGLVDKGVAPPLTHASGINALNTAIASAGVRLQESKAAPGKLQGATRAYARNMKSIREKTAQAGVFKAGAGVLVGQPTAASTALATQSIAGLPVPIHPRMTQTVRSGIAVSDDTLMRTLQDPNMRKSVRERARRTLLKRNRGMIAKGLGGGLLDIATFGLGGQLIQGLQQRKKIALGAGVGQKAGLPAILRTGLAKASGGSALAKIGAVAGTGAGIGVSLFAKILPLLTMLGKGILALAAPLLTIKGAIVGFFAIGVIAQWKSVAGFFKQVWHNLSTFFTALKDTFMIGMNIIGSLFPEGTAQGIWNAVKLITTPIKWLFDFLTWIASGFGQLLDKWATWAKFTRQDQEFVKRYGNIDPMKMTDKQLTDMTARSTLPSAHDQISEDMRHWLKTGEITPGLLKDKAFTNVKGTPDAFMKTGQGEKDRLAFLAKSMAKEMPGETAVTPTTDTMDLSGGGMAATSVEYINMRGIDDLVQVTKAGFKELVLVNRQGFGLEVPGAIPGRTSDAASGGVVINVYAQPGQSVEEIATAVKMKLDAATNSDMFETEVN